MDLLLVLACVGVLAGLVLPALARAKESGKQASCVNNLRQMAGSLSLYAHDNNGDLPPRTVGGTAAQPDPRWPGRLLPYYKDVTALVCPGDGPSRPSTVISSANAADASPRSYILNGWNDFFGASFSDVDVNQTIPSCGIEHPAGTISFGEKITSSPHYYMDLYEYKGDGYDQLNQNLHANRAGSNYAFADGSVRFLTAWSPVGPVYNLWAVTPAARTNYAVLARRE